MGRAGGWAVYRYRHLCHRIHLADSLKRHLLISRRRIPLDRSEHYARLWHDVQRLVTNAGGRAWLFRAERSSDLFVEFVEWESDAEHPLTGRPEIAQALTELETTFAAKDSDNWIEVKI